jgi:hypothetical protein
VTAPDPLKVLTDELIAAWKAWDRACTPPARHPSAHTLQAEAARLTAAERALGTPLGYTARIAALRWHKDGRPHLSVPDAVQTVVLELFPLARVDHLPEPRQHKEAC